MKIIHTADIHLGSRMDSRFPAALSARRREELRNSFKRLVEYAKREKIGVILLAGDVFDSDAPYRKDKEFFYSVVRNNPEIDFLYLRGNHDTEAGYGEEMDNLKTFGNEWQNYSFEEVVITGIEITGENATSMYSTLALDPAKKNIVMLHGQVGVNDGVDKINLKKLRGKHIDYLALGHIHKPSSDKLDEGSEYVYCGCLEGRGFDEIGPRGFEVVEVGEKITHTFVPFSDRIFVEADVDIGDAQDLYGAYKKITGSVAFDPRNFYRICLTGEVDFDTDSLCSDLEAQLKDACAFVSVKDRTRKKLDIHAYDGDTSLRGEFVREVYANPAYSEEEKIRIVTYGLRALKGEDVE